MSIIKIRERIIFKKLATIPKCWWDSFNNIIPVMILIKNVNTILIIVIDTSFIILIILMI